MKISAGLLRYIMIRSFFILLFAVILVTFIAFARGYRFNFQDGSVTSTGILSVNSSPKPAKVYVDGVLKGATDINLTLPYGKYTVEIKKDGYTGMKKTVSLKGEIVMSINALLFPKNPSLAPLTNLGIIKAIPVDGTDRIILFTQNNDVEKDGIYLFESTKQTISLFPPLKLILLKELLPQDIDFNKTEVYFSPDNRDAIFTFKNETTEYSYILNLESENKDLFDMTESKQTVIDTWRTKKEKDLVKILETFPRDIRKIASDSFRLIAFSPDENKILYQATRSAVLKTVITPPVIGGNQTPEEREIVQDRLYVYDKKEDKNFIINIPVQVENVSISPTETVAERVVTDDDIRNNILSYIRWYPDSNHLVIREKNVIDIMGYDGTNKITVYSGPFEQNFYAIAPDWNLLILANLNPQNNEYGDLYSIGIR